MDVRIHDYLDDKFQSLADLETLDSLLENVKQQQLLLKQQLADAKREHDETEREAAQCATSVKQKGGQFQKTQGDIDKRLIIFTQSEASDDAVQAFEASMSQLRKLDIAVGYVTMLEQVQDVKNQSLSHLGSSDELVLQPYTRLRKLAASLHPLQDAAEGAAPHLLDAINQQVNEMQQLIKGSFSPDLESTLKRINWPKPTETVPLALEKEWRKNVERLLDLQRPELEAWDVLNTNTRSHAEPVVLFPLEIMAHQLEQRFTYHFSGNKPTNRLDKPEYFLSHISELITTHADFVQNSLQPILAHAFRGSNLALYPAFIDASCAFVTSLLPMLRTKLRSFSAQVKDQPQLFSHLMHELMAFDTTLRESQTYTPVAPTSPWRGLSYDLLEKHDLFPTWLAVEKNFALTRYQSILDTADAGELDYDSVSNETSKPTRAAIRVNDLLETITDHYRPLMSFSQKLRFLIDIQIAIFDRFHQRLHSSLEAYLSMTSTIGRTMHGVSKEDQNQLQGIKGLDRLCRVFGSAEYLERAMRDWSDDVFFLDLWDELQMRAQTPERISEKLGGLHAIQQKTSSSVGEADQSGDGEFQGALFDETAAAYRRLRVRSEGIIVETVTNNVKEALRPYGRMGTWASLSSTSAGMTVSAELEPALRLIGEYLGFLSRAVGRGPLRRITKQVGVTVQSFMWDSVLLRNSFSTTGAAQLATDVGAICSSLDRLVGMGHGRLAVGKLVDGVTLLGLPVKAEIEREQPSLAGDDDDITAWDETANDDDGGEGADDLSTGKKLGLFEAERLVFLDNESARKALDQLGLEVLSEADARVVLRKRVELGS